MAEPLYEVRYDGRVRSYTYPDIIPAESSSFATLVPHRSPEFKVHRTEAQANAALSHHHLRGAKYELKGGVWTKVWEYVKPTACEKCKRDDVNVDLVVAWGYKGSLINRVFHCRDCYNLDRDEWMRADREKRERAELAKLQAKYPN